MYIRDNRIRGIDDGLQTSTVKTFPIFGYEQVVGLITVTFHKDNVPEDGNASFGW